VDFSQPSAIVLGSEAAGLSDAWLADDVIPIRLPMRVAAGQLERLRHGSGAVLRALRQRG
jgi:tRNA G18 (ribose-2'-O)-methylase SpoU